MNNTIKTTALVNALMLAITCSAAQAATPKFTIVPVVPGSNSDQVKKGDIFDISYTVTNNLNDTKTLTMQPLKGVIQVTRGANNCDTLFRLAPKESCNLRLKVDTNALPVGSTLQNGPEVCIGPSRLSCSRPSPSNLLDIDIITAPDAPLTASSFDVVTAVTSTTTNPASLSRTVLIRNTGSEATESFSYVRSGFTNYNLTGCPGQIPAGSSCTLTITPNNIPNNTGAVSPTPGKIIVDGGPNSNRLVIDVTVLGFGNIYQGGYLFKVDPTTPPQSNIGGTVAELSDLQNGKSFNWPGAGTLFPVNANSLIDGRANTESIVSVYKAGNYAANACSQLRVNEAGAVCLSGVDCYSNWYLPAICEVGEGVTYSANCDPYPDNMMSNLNANGYGNFNQNTTYWTSTSYSEISSAEGWRMNPPAAIPYNFSWQFPVRCARTIN